MRFRSSVVRGIEIVEGMLARANAAQRVPAPVSEIMVGLQCGV